MTDTQNVSPVVKFVVKICFMKNINVSNAPHQLFVCCKTFKQNDTLLLHEKTHSEEYKCSTCGKYFVQSSHLY